MHHHLVLCLVAGVAWLHSASAILPDVLTTAVETAALEAETARLGCYQYEDDDKDDDGIKQWKEWKNTHSKNTPAACANICQGYKFAAISGGTGCKCGDVLPSTRAADGRCDSPCLGDPHLTCGGDNAVEVFQVVPKPAVQGTPLGCFKDSTDRVWQNGNMVLQNNTPQRCMNACRGFRYAGLEYGSECYCGDSLPATPLPRSQCQADCWGAKDRTCGGSWAMEAFELTEAHAQTTSQTMVPASAQQSACPQVVQCPVCPTLVESPVQVVGKIPEEYRTRADLGTSYRLYAERKTWHDAWQQCDDDDAHLVVIDSEDEAAFVRSLFAQVPSETRMHAGFHDLLRRGSYRTLLGASLAATGYNVWSTQHPSTPSAASHCGCVDAHARLAQIDGNCDARALFLCERKQSRRALTAFRWTSVTAARRWPSPRNTWFNYLGLETSQRRL